MSLCFLTLNCWGIPFVSHRREERINAIIDYILSFYSETSPLKTLPPSVVCLQEIWLSKDYLLLIDKLSFRYPYYYYYKTGILGSGCVVFSQFKFQQVTCRVFSLNGKMADLARVIVGGHVDWVGAKCVGLVRIRFEVPQQQPHDISSSVKFVTVDIYNTHLHANYDVIPKEFHHKNYTDEYKSHRLTQIWELGQFIRNHSPKENLVILMGDLNSPPHSLEYHFLTGTMRDGSGCAGLRDAFIDTKRNPNRVESMKRSLMAELETMPQSLNLVKDRLYKDALEGVTCQALSNSFTSPSTMDKYPAERIDYIMYRATKGWTLDYARVCALKPLDDPNGGRIVNMSDHFGLLAVFEYTGLARGSTTTSATAANQQPVGSVPRDALLVSPISEESDEQDEHIPLTVDIGGRIEAMKIVPEMIDALTMGIRESRTRMKSHRSLSLVWFIAYFALLLAGLILVGIDITRQSIPAWAWVLGVFATYVTLLFGVYESILGRMVVMAEVSGLERVRSEIVLWVRGHFVPSTQTTLEGSTIPVPMQMPIEWVCEEVYNQVFARDSRGDQPARYSINDLRSLIPAEEPEGNESTSPSSGTNTRRYTISSIPMSLFPRKRQRQHSNMSNPIPTTQSEDLLALSTAAAVSSVLGLRSGDHPASDMLGLRDVDYNIKSAVQTTLARVEGLVRRDSDQDGSAGPNRRGSRRPLERRRSWAVADSAETQERQNSQNVEV